MVRRNYNPYPLFCRRTSRKQVDIEKAFVTIDWFDDKNVLRSKTFTDIGDGQSFSEHTVV